MRPHRPLAPLFALLVLVAGCHLAEVATAPSPAAGPVPRAGESRVVLYLNGPPQSPLQVSFELTSIEAVRADGFRATLSTTPTTIASLDIVERQRRLAEAFVPHGRYTQLALGVTRARLRREGRWIDLSVPAGGVVLVPASFEVRPREATPLFLAWDVDRAIEGEAFFRGSFSVEGKAQELRRVLAYVTNEASGTLSVIDRTTDRVVSVLELGRRPRGVAVSDDVTRAYVVDAAADTLSIIDVNTSRVQHTTNLEVGAGASWVVVTSDHRRLYVSNTALNSVSAIDAASFQIVQTIPVGFRPERLALVRGRPLVLVSNTGSHTLSVIDTVTNTVIATVQVDLQPAGLAIDSAGAQAFVSHLGSPRLSVVSLSGFRVVRTANAGAAAAILLDTEAPAPRVFLARPLAPRVSLFDVTLNSELRTIAVGKQPRDLALDAEREKLYVVDRGSDSVSVIDRNSLRVRATVEVGRSPFAVAIVP